MNSNFVYDNCICHRGFVATEDNNIIHINGDVTLEDEVPVVCNGVVRIEGTPDSVLHLVANSERQPCIGAKTHTGMSYGRWSPSGICPVRIEIDGCTVTCESKVLNFTIGKYGTNDMPEIVLLNDAKLICPEMDGERVITYQATAPEGSTKISESMQYGIRRAGQTDWDLFSEEKEKIESSD